MFGRKRQPLTPDQKKKLKRRQQEIGRAAYRANQQSMQAVRSIPRNYPH